MTGRKFSSRWSVPIIWALHWRKGSQLEEMKRKVEDIQFSSHRSFPSGENPDKGARGESITVPRKMHCRNSWTHFPDTVYWIKLSHAQDHVLIFFVRSHLGSSIFAPDVTRFSEVKVFLKCALFFCGAFVRKTLAVAMSNGERDFVVGSARRRRERRLRCFSMKRDGGTHGAGTCYASCGPASSKCANWLTPRLLLCHRWSNTWFQHLPPLMLHQIYCSSTWHPHLWLNTSCLHLQWLMLRPVNSYLLPTPWQPSILTSTSTLPVWCTRNFRLLLLTSSFRWVWCARVQPNPSGTGRCRDGDSTQSWKSSCARTGYRSRNSSSSYCGADTGTNCWHCRFGEPAIFHYRCSGFCATGRWLTSFFRRVWCAREYNQIHQEQIVATVQPLVTCYFSRNSRGAGCGADTGTNCWDYRSDSTRACDTAHLRANWGADEHELHVDQWADRGHSFSSGCGRCRRHVGRAGHPHNQQLAKLEEVSSSIRLRLQVLTKSSGSRHAVRQAQNEWDLLEAQSREAQQFVHDKKQLLAELLREKQLLLNTKRRRLGGVDSVRVGTRPPGVGFKYRALSMRVRTTSSWC